MNELVKVNYDAEQKPFVMGRDLYEALQIWFLYQQYAEMGYTSTKTSIFHGTDGLPHSKVHTYWTQKGRLFIYQLMKADGHLPIMEQGW